MTTFPPFIATDNANSALCNRCPDDALDHIDDVPAHLKDPARRRWHGRWEAPTQGELDVRDIIERINARAPEGGAYTEALVDAFRPYLESRAPFNARQVADQIKEAAPGVEWDQDETCAWWAFMAPGDGPFNGAVVVLEWDYTGWRWGYSRRPDADIDAVIPISGTGPTVVADLLAILTEPLPDAAEGLATVATEDGTVTTSDRSAMNRFTGRAAQLLADPALRNN